MQQKENDRSPEREKKGIGLNKASLEGTGQVNARQRDVRKGPPNWGCQEEGNDLARGAGRKSSQGKNPLLAYLKRQTSADWIGITRDFHFTKKKKVDSSVLKGEKEPSGGTGNQNGGQKN